MQIEFAAVLVLIFLLVVTDLYLFKRVSGVSSEVVDLSAKVAAPTGDRDYGLARTASNLVPRKCYLLKASASNNAGSSNMYVESSGATDASNMLFDIERSNVRHIYVPGAFMHYEVQSVNKATANGYTVQFSNNPPTESLSIGSTLAYVTVVGLPFRPEDSY